MWVVIEAKGRGRVWDKIDLDTEPGAHQHENEQEDEPKKDGEAAIEQLEVTQGTVMSQESPEDYFCEWGDFTTSFSD